MKLAILAGLAMCAHAQDGANLFASRCAGCHGADGAGGEHAPAIGHRPNLRDIIANGIKDRGMPAFSFTATEMTALTAYIGTFRTSAERIESPVTVTLENGKTLSGIKKNESNYELQLLGTDGRLHVISKSRDQRGPIDASGDWPTYHGNFNGNRHSNLKQIDVSNVEHLAPAWMFPIANAKRLEGTPIVVDGVMYVTTANECYALDARSGRQIWHYGRPLTKGLIGDASSAINRGVAVLSNKIFMVTDHAHIIALNRVDGRLLWDTEMADFHSHYGATGAPLVVGNLVLSGTSGGDEGAPGFIAAFDTETGKQAWRFSTIEGPKTWIGRAIEHGCVDAWFTGTYDSDLVYWPTGNPCPDYNGDERKGDNLYANSVVALEPKTGKLRWYYQFTPHDLHDWDAVAPLLAIDTLFKGKPRKLLLQANRNGFFYVLDRITGEFLLGEPFVKKMDWADGIDAKGRPMVRASATPTPEGTKACPNAVGATNWFSSAYNPETKFFYVMALESCGIFTKSDAWWEPGKSFYGGGTKRVPGEKPERFLRALDIQTGKTVWEIPQIGGGAGWGGLLSTAGGLVFFCDESGAFAAADAKSGKLLWHFFTNQGWHASPMTYAVDGKQYVAVAAGSNFISFALP
ncbi:MAG TPA: PQQ-binding-like beta-propeller repeat protein [Bryobacteraceae bacterium]|jgi:alcohol dehydrogenase (cytochrome c)|nr:PQQ-binding-like beta-propeller repeat protein [Bryobacteraceae bacterium]